MKEKEMKRINNKSGFTLLEIIVVIIIIGVLAGLALPRLFSTVEYSKASEALSNLSTIRQAVARCFMSSSVAANCDAISKLDIEDPSATPGARFDYTISVTDQDNYTIEATRDTLVDCSGCHGGKIALTIASGAASRSGTSDYKGVH